MHSRNGGHKEKRKNCQTRAKDVCVRKEYRNNTPMHRIIRAGMCTHVNVDMCKSEKSIKAGVYKKQNQKFLEKNYQKLLISP